MELMSSDVGLRFAVVGCSHGALDRIYESVSQLEQQGGYTIDAILCCGDFQAMRNQYDLDTMVAPNKYKTMEDFWRYYSGEKMAPRLTIFVGGNHEAVVHSRELYYGGWAAPNIYFLGYSGMIDVGGVKIAGFSGIYKPGSFKSGHYEVPPYNFERPRPEPVKVAEDGAPGPQRKTFSDQDDIRTAHYVRLFELWKLAHLGGRVRPDIIMSHDWPEFIAHYGHKDTLLRLRPQFKKSLDEHTLGGQPYMKLMRHLQPRFWLSGHMHVKYTATVQHADNTPDPALQTGKMLDLTKLLQQQESQITHPVCHKHAACHTDFLALDKPIPGREFMDVIHLPFASGERETEIFNDEFGDPLPAAPRLCHDLDWLSIVKASHDHFPNHKGSAQLLPQLHPNAINKARNWIIKNCLNGDQFNSEALRVAPSSFIRSADVYVEGKEANRTSPIVGPQTEAFLRWLDLDSEKLLRVDGLPVNPNKAARAATAPATSPSVSEPSSSNASSSGQ